MTVDVVVVSYESRAQLRGCVLPLAREPGVRVIVVDNASSDGSLATVADLPVERIALDENHGFAAGCNVGCRAGDAPAVLFLNPDARIDAGSLARLLAELGRDASIGVVAPKIVDEHGNVEPSQRRFPALRSTYARAFFLHRVFPNATWADELIRDVRAYEEPGSPDWVSGACILVRRRALDAIGGLDEEFFLYGEDIDLARRLRSAGYGVRFEPAAVAVHEGGRSGHRPRLLPLLAESRLRYLRRHHSRLEVALARIGLALNAFTHVLFSSGGYQQRLGHARSLPLIVFNRTGAAGCAASSAAAITTTLAGAGRRAT